MFNEGLVMRLFNSIWICFFLFICTAHAQSHDQSDAVEPGWGISAWSKNDEETQAGSEGSSEEMSECDRLSKMATAIREQRAYFYPSDITRGVGGRIVGRKVRISDSAPGDAEEFSDDGFASEESQPAREERIYLDEHELRMHENELRALNCPI